MRRAPSTSRVPNWITKRISWAGTSSSSTRTPTRPVAAENRSQPDSSRSRRNRPGMAQTSCPFLLMDHDQPSTHSDPRRQLQMARSMCWHCQSEVTGEYFCEWCVKVQPVSKETDYFTCLGSPRRLTLDPKKLEAKFYELSWTFHPDFYQTKSTEEQTISLSNAAVLNTAYRTLRDPIQRAEYLLALETGSVKDIRTSPPADLFEEILELQDTVEEYRASDRGSDQSHRIRVTLQTEQEALERRKE